MEAIQEIKKLIKENKLLLGTDTTMKALKAGKLSKIYATSNCPADVREDLEHYSKLSGVEIVNLDIANDELGVVCKKTFRISIIGLKK